MTYLLPNGMGAPQADSLAVRGPVYISDQVWYVNSATGVDAVSPRGLTEEYPLATLAQAITNIGVSGAGRGTVVLMRDHAETIAAQINAHASFNVNIIGAGLSAGRPTVKITNGFAGGSMLLIEGTTRLRNIWFTAPSVVTTQATVDCQGFLQMDGCYFESSDNNDAGGYGLLMVASASAIIRDTTFVSTATSATDRPESGFAATNTTRLLRMSNVTFDGGPMGWDTYAATFALAATFKLSVERLSLLRGADVSVASGTEGFIQIATATEGARVDW